MLPTTSLLAAVAAALSLAGALALATPIASPAPAALPFNTHFLRADGAPTNIVERDLARIAHLRAQGQKRAAAHAAANGRDKRASAASFAVTNAAVRSSNTWLGASKKYVKTSTSTSTGKRVSVSYGSGSFSGTEYTDTVALASSLVISAQSIGVATTATGFNDVDGILGIGPVDLTDSTVTGVSSVPTVTDSLLSQGKMSTEVIGISYAPAISASAANGELTFGDTDPSKYTGSIAYVPLTSTSPANEYWGIDQSLAYGGATLFSTTAGIVDTGTTLFYIPTSAFNAYAKATGGSADSSTGLLALTPAQYAQLQDLDVLIGRMTYPLTPNAQIWPRSLNTAIGGTAGSIYLTVADAGAEVGSGLDFILGYVFLERYYSVFDTTNSRIGFAPTAHTSDTTN